MLENVAALDWESLMARILDLHQPRLGAIFSPAGADRTCPRRSRPRRRRPHRGREGVVPLERGRSANRGGRPGGSQRIEVGRLEGVESAQCDPPPLRGLRQAGQVRAFPTSRQRSPHPDLPGSTSTASPPRPRRKRRASPGRTTCPIRIPVPARGVPAFGPGLAPLAGPLGRARDGGPQRRQPRCLPLDPAPLQCDPPRSRSTRVPPRRGLFPLGAAADPILRRAVRIPPRLAGKRRLVGPGLWDPPAEEPAWLAQEERPILLLSASTEFQDDGALIRIGLEALAEEPYAVVVTTAAHDPTDFAAPANARIERFFSPHSVVGPCCSRRLPRRYGDDAEGACRRGPSLRRPFPTRPVRDRPAGRDLRRGDEPARAQATTRKSARRGARRDRESAGRGADRRLVRRGGWRRGCRHRARGTAGVRSRDVTTRIA